MKKIQRFCTLFLLMIGLCFSALHAQSYEKLWKQVEQAQKKSLPQTVVKLTGKIYRKAELEKNAPQMLKAYICREAYQEKLTPDSLYTNLKNLESWTKSERNPVSKAILHSLLAREYADYMRGNRRLLSERTALDADEAPTGFHPLAWGFFQRIRAFCRAGRRKPFLRSRYVSSAGSPCHRYLPVIGRLSGGLIAALPD